MDYTKTGQLIAARRKEYGLTQKQLAEKLSVSDRTISKWERGIGFPDISLLEPLADELTLSVIELMHGEKSDGADAAAESSARYTVRTLSGEFQRLKKVRKHARLMLVISIVIVVLTASVLLLYLNADYKILNYKEVPMAHAVSKMPEIIITGEEYALAEYVLNLKAVREAIGSTTEVPLAEDLSKQLCDRVDINGKPPDSITISVHNKFVYIGYAVDSYRFFLWFTSPDDVNKTAVQYDRNLDIKYGFDNYNNTTVREYYTVKALFPPKAS